MALNRLPRVLAVSNMYPGPPQPAYGSFVASQVESLRALGVETDVLFVDGRTSRLNYARGIQHMRQMMACGQYDLVHAHYGITGWVARCQRALPMVVSFCGDDILGTPGEDGKPTQSSRAVVSASHILEKFADGIIVKSEEMRQRLWLESSKRRALVLPNGVDLSFFCPTDRARARQSLGLSPHKKYVLFPNTPYALRKRVEMAKEAVAHLERRMPDVELLIVYHQPPAKMPLYYSAADALLLTSDWEGSPNVVKEALACNLPVVSVATGDVAERIAGLPSCQICPREPAALSVALEQALRGERPTTLRAAVSSLDTAIVAQRLLELYQSVTKAPRESLAS